LTLPAGSARGREAAALAVMMASGFAGLGYQIVWTQQCALWLGHEAPAVLAVVGAFFGGLAVGALAFGPVIERSRAPRRWYAGAEALIALWSLLLALTMAPASEVLLALIGPQPTPLRQWTLAFAGTFLLLLPATAAMGATLPAMARIAAGGQDARDRRRIAALYAANTFGAVLGVLAIAFLLVPAFGLRATALVCVALNLACALAAWRVLPSGADTRPAPRQTTADPLLSRRLFVTGLLGIGYEIVVVRVIGEVAEDTVYTFALLLAVYLVGSAAGAAAYRRLAVRHGDDPERLCRGLLLALAFSCLIGAASLWAADQVHAAVLAALPPAMASALAAEATLALLAFALPTLAMGAMFSHLATEASRAGLGLGRALGLNTIGAALAPPLFGVLLLPTFGAGGALLLVAAGYFTVLTRRRADRPALLAAAPMLALLLLAAVLPPLAFVDVPPGGRLLSYRDGVMAAVSVTEDADGVRSLRINNRQQEGSSATQRVDGRQALMPLLLHPAPESVLFLGLGTGTTAATAAIDRSLDVVAVELLPEVIAASALFAQPAVPAAPDGRPTMVAGDARRQVRTGTGRLDVIVSDNFHPARSGSGALYTVEHFAAVRARLADDGLFCQWLPLHQLDPDSLKSIIRSFLAVFPDGRALLANYSLDTPTLGLIGQRSPRPFAMAALDARLAAASAPPPSRYGLEDAVALLGSFVAGPAELARYAGDAVANTDDRPIVAYRAPRLVYAPDSSPAERLLTLLEALSISPADLIGVDADRAALARLTAYRQARDAFIRLGRGVRPGGDVEALLAQVGVPLFGVLRTSPDFRPAYDPLLAMAQALAGRDPAQAADLLKALIAAQPARPEAADVLRALEGGRS
jgi:spermidine synthase